LQARKLKHGLLTDRPLGKKKTTKEGKGSSGVEGAFEGGKQERSPYNASTEGFTDKNRPKQKDAVVTKKGRLERGEKNSGGDGEM